MSAVLPHSIRRATAILPLAFCTALACGGADAASRGTPAAAAPTEFDGAAAMGWVRKQVEFGPRVPGTPAHKAAGDWLMAELRKRADTVYAQEWVHTTADGKKLPMRNIVARFRPADAKRVLYLAHWDSRPLADKETDPALAAMPVPGANDGGSGVAILLGVADALKKRAPAVGVDLVLTDGEDWGSFDTMTDVLIGASYFGDHLPSAGYAPLFGVLWDMVGDADPSFGHESHSVRAAPEVVQRVWAVAQRLGHGSVFTTRDVGPITDDHVPLIERGLRVIDVIDLGFEWHHTTQDTPDKVSQKSLQIVGDVAITVIRDLAP